MTSSEGFNCIFCKESFQNKEDLQIHFRKHGDPKFNQNNKSGKSDTTTGGEKSEDGEMVRCDVCEESFPTISKAITHKHKVHPDYDAKYFCPWCGKLFTMKHLYNKHVQSVHESKEERTGNTGFHCDYCEVDFFLPAAMVYHNKYFHRQDTELAAIGHSRKLKSFEQESLPIYYCPFCGEEYCNKVNLHKHMGDDHIDENQSPEDVLRCPLCDAVFYHLDAYELHLTFHSTEDLYVDENEMSKDIREFSLETVPPIMEKVENESQEDEPSQSMGIEELLQQAMNESNGEGIKEKKKKHKKHKKSKNAAITLDEFLTMNTDLFGEGLDVEGIVEVPTQVVAKSLNRKMPRAKPGPKPLPTELQKLKKAGIVVKKKPASLQGDKMVAKNPVLRPGLKISHGSDKTKPVLKKPDTTMSSNDALSKLLHQSNSQIKIVKKSSNEETQDILAKDKDLPQDKESDTENNAKEIEEMAPEISSSTDNNKATIDHIENNDNDECTSQDGLQAQDPANKRNVIHFKDELTKLKENGKESQKNQQINESSEVLNKSPDKSKGNINTLDALRNISQQISIKSLSSQSDDLKPDNKKPDNELFDDSEAEHKMTSEVTKTESKDCKSDSPQQTHRKLLNPLQHLSHLTVKTAKQSNVVSPVSKSDMHEKTDTESENENVGDLDSDEESQTRNCKDNAFESSSANNENPSSKLNALKNLSKHITVKSLSQSPNSPTVAKNGSRDEKLQERTGKIESISSTNKVLPIKTPNIKESSISKNSSSPKHSPNINKTSEVTKAVQKPFKEQANKNEQAASILKQFPYITAKPVSSQNTIKQTRNENQDQSSNVDTTQKEYLSTPEVETTKEVEVFNIDDSDEEEEHAVFKQNINNKADFESSPKILKHKNKDKSNTMSPQVLKNLGKNITIKSSNPAKHIKTTHHEDPPFDDEDPTDDWHDTDNQVLEQKSSLLQNKLKGLNNLTVKSTTTSPKICPAAKNLNLNNQTEEYDSDSSNSSSKVKITELPHDYTSDDDVPLQQIKSETNVKNHSLPVNSQNDHYDEDDIENQITPTKLVKPTTSKESNNLTYLNNLKNISIKSSKEKIKNVDENYRSEDEYDFHKALVPYQNQNVSIKRISQQPKNESRTSPQTSKQIIGRTVNQNTSQSSNQVNTVNKEIKVQKFQTQTVVQEITTTVTKTIRTINETVKHEFRNTTQNLTTTRPMTPQKVQGMRPQAKNLVGCSVRGQTPTMGPRPRGMTPTRPTAHTNIRPSNQLVPIKPGTNLARPSYPRMQVARRMPPPSTATNLSIGKPLRISPNAMMPPAKRPQNKTEEDNGPFSCFKKPKESLFPTGDDSDSTINFSSTQMSQSNFTSTTKIMKGNSVVTSTQSKSHMAASTEQVNRLNSLAGLKVVKTSQAKQMSTVEEKTEVSPAKRSALEAIAKLQKQGLLVKKPKVDEPEPTVEEPDSETELNLNGIANDDDYYDDDV